jgi:hypothetical protein
VMDGKGHVRSIHLTMRVCARCQYVLVVRSLEEEPEKGGG